MYIACMSSRKRQGRPRKGRKPWLNAHNAIRSCDPQEYHLCTEYKTDPSTQGNIKITETVEQPKPHSWNDWQVRTPGRVPKSEVTCKGAPPHQ